MPLGPILRLLLAGLLAGTASLAPRAGWGDSRTPHSSVGHQVAHAATGDLGAWTATSSLPRKRYMHDAVFYNGHIYAVGGYDQGYIFPTVERATVNSDGTLGPWVTAGSMSQGRWGVRAVATGAWLYVLGGVTSGFTTLNSVERVKIRDDGTLEGPWLSASPMNTSRAMGPVFAANGYMYYLGGYSYQAGRLSSVEAAKINADGSLGSWTVVGALTEAKYDGAAIVLGGYVYYIGGYKYDAYLSTVEKASLGSDGTLGSWVTTSSLNYGRSSLAAVAVGSYVYALGGANVAYSPPAMKTVERSAVNEDGSLTSWQVIGYMSAYRYKFPGLALSCRIYAIGGAGASDQEQASVEYSEVEGNCVFSSVRRLDEYSIPSFTVSWSGTGSIASYDIQYKDGASGTWTDWLTSTTATSTTFTGQDGHTYYFQSRARDGSGNTEAYPGGNGDAYTTVDLTAPTGSVSINGGALYATAVTVTLNLSATDAASGPGQMAFSNDGVTFSGWENYAASKTWALTAADGLKTVYARLRDNAGNASTVYSDTITLISAPASGAIVINGGDLYTRFPTVTLALSPPDLPYTSQMQFSDDGLSYSSFEPFTTTRPYTLTAGDGLKAVWVRYKSVTETVTGPYSDTIILDTAPPTATVGSLAAYQNSPSFRVNWSATDATSGPASYDLQYREGLSGAWTDWITATAALSSTFNGQDGRTYGFRARATDNAGNQGDYPAAAQAQTTVDTRPPTGSLSAPAYASSTAITLTLAATDTFGVAGMAFSSDGSAWGSWEPYTTTRPYTLASGDGQKTVYGKFRDNAGNYSSPYSATVLLDTTPPGQPFPDDGVSGTSRNPTPTFSWAPVTDNLSGVAGYSWRVDSGAETYTTTTTLILPSQADGEHTFYVRALDRAGNYGSYGSHLFTINTAAPAPPDILQPQSPTAADKIIVSGAAPPNSTVKLYANESYFGQATAGAYGIWNLVNVPIRMGENVLKATATDSYGLTSALSSPMVVMRVPVYYTPPADMASGVVAPSAGGTVTTTNNYMVIVPQGAITQSVKVVLTPLAPQSAPTVFGILGTESYVALSAVTSDTGEKVASFQEPVTVTLSYDPAKLTVPESSLAIHYYDEALGQWVALPSLVDTVNHTVSAQTTHFTVFGVLASLPWRGYLPLVTRGYASGW